MISQDELRRRVEVGRERRVAEEAKKVCVCKKFAWKTALEIINQRHDKGCYWYKEKKG